MTDKNWQAAEPASPQQLRRLNVGNPVLAQVLINRGIDTPEAAQRFLLQRTSGSDQDFNPFNLPDMHRATNRIIQAIKQDEHIVVYGDFDADGVTATTLMVEALDALGANVKPYIPHRVDEGYGLNHDALEKLADDGATLIITVDCGIRSVDEISQASVDIIVTDHHSLGPEMPEAAYAVVNPKRGEYIEDMLAGVGVAFKVVQALIMKTRNDAYFTRSNGQQAIPLNSLHDLVAIGTVADLMPLDHIENRIMVRRGLQALNKAERPGLRALLAVAGIEPGKVTSTSIAFGIAPRINAAGRLESAMLAYELLRASGDAEATRLAEQLNTINRQRQEITQEAYESIESRLNGQRELTLITDSSPDLSPGIVGLVAGKLTQQYFRPSVIMEEGDDEWRGSCRSIPQFDITAALDQCADLLVRHGGHAMAAGFTVHRDNAERLQAQLQQIAERQLAGLELRPTLEIDMELDTGQLDEALVDSLSGLEPYGHGNQPPVFVTRDLEVLETRTVGQDGKHLKLRLKRHGGQPLDAIGFQLGHWAHDMPDRIDIAYHIEINEWKGRRTLQANIQDLRPAGDNMNQDGTSRRFEDAAKDGAAKGAS